MEYLIINPSRRLLCSYLIIFILQVGSWTIIFEDDGKIPKTKVTKNHHGGVNLKKKNPSKNLSFKTVDVGNKKCELCDEEFSDLQIYKSHLISHHKSKDGKKYLCAFCEYRTHQKTHIIDHTRWHKGIKPYSCNLCSYKVSQKSNLVCHMKSHYNKRHFLEA